MREGSTKLWELERAEARGGSKLNNIFSSFSFSLLNNRRGKREDVSQENICHFLQIDDDQIFTESNCYRM